MANRNAMLNLLDQANSYSQSTTKYRHEWSIIRRWIVDIIDRIDFDMFIKPSEYDEITCRFRTLRRLEETAMFGDTTE